MDISINGKPADLVPDTEKTLGELLSALESWLAGSGHRLSALRVNGETITAAAMGEAFNRDLGGIKRLEIGTSTWTELAAEALAALQDFLEDWEGASFEDRSRLQKAWTESPSGAFLEAELPDLFSLADRSFQGEGPLPAELALLAGERLRELSDPWGEFEKAGTLVDAVAERLEELPLDIQTGKDGRAAETVRLFSGTAEKIFRLLRCLKERGLKADDLKVADMPAGEFIGEFDAALKELLAAYQMKDTVLVGDLAEYELAPRLRKLYGAVKGSGMG